MGNLFLEIIKFFYYNLAFQNLGLTIIEIAIVSRLAFYPLLKKQAHYTRKMAEIQPHLSALKEKHKDNQQAMAQAQMELFKQHGVNPAAGCLPAIVQIVILFGLLGAMNTILKMNLNTSFYFWNMAKPDAFLVKGLPFEIPGVLVVIAAVTQFIQTKMMMPAAVPAKASTTKEIANKTEKKGDFMSEFADAQSSMIWLFPLMFLFLGTKWPSGLPLYWSVGSLLAIVQQYQTAGLGGLEQYVVKLKAILGVGKR